MADLLLAALRVLLEFLLYALLYATGRFLLPLMSFGRIKVAPWREPVARVRVASAQSTGEIVAGYRSCTFVAFLFWTVLVLLLVHFTRSSP